MNRVLHFIEQTASHIATSSARIGARVDLSADVLDRAGSIALKTPGLVSANGSCRMVRARDGWVAVNLPRPDDLADVPALLGVEVGNDPWSALHHGATQLTCAELVARAESLSLAIAALGETPAPPGPCAVLPGDKTRRASLRVLDFSALWAGPLCGSVFAAMGADVVKLDSAERPDTTTQAAPALHQRLNGAKTQRTLSLTTDQGRAALQDEAERADVLITSARTRALADLGIKRRDGQIWIAITGHGFDSARIAFGDDAAASGGLVRWEDGAPRFLGDALADPLTGLAAASAALALVEDGRDGVVDAALARTAAFVAALT